MLVIKPREVRFPGSPLTRKSNVKKSFRSGRTRVTAGAPGFLCSSAAEGVTRGKDASLPRETVGLGSWGRQACNLWGSVFAWKPQADFKITPQHRLLRLQILDTQSVLGGGWNDFTSSHLWAPAECWMPNLGADSQAGAGVAIKKTHSSQCLLVPYTFSSHSLCFSVEN